MIRRSYPARQTLHSFKSRLSAERLTESIDERCQHGKSAFKGENDVDKGEEGEKRNKEKARRRNVSSALCKHRDRLAADLFTRTPTVRVFCFSCSCSSPSAECRQRFLVSAPASQCVTATTRHYDSASTLKRTQIVGVSEDASFRGSRSSRFCQRTR